MSLQVPERVSAVIIIGGGVTGSSVAWQFATPGRSDVPVCVRYDARGERMRADG